MATKINVNGKIVSRPGVYASTKSGIRNPPLNLSYGNIVIIDDGVGANFGGGAGSLGTATQGVDSVYELPTIQAFRDFVKGGELWNLAEPLFRPAGNGIPGVSKVYMIHARESVAATVTYTLTNGSFTVQTIDEGLNANGTLTSGNLTAGYAMKIRAGIVNPAKFIFSFYHATYKGIDALNNTPYGGITAANSVPLLIINSDEVSTLAELFAWMDKSSDFKTGFKRTAQTITSTGAITSGDLTTLAGYKVFAGGTETYSANAFTAALAATKDLDFTFFLCTKYGADATGTNNAAILDFLVNESKFERFAYVGGGYNKADFSSVSIAASNFYNSDRMVVVHGGALKTITTGFRTVSQLWKTAAVLGRTCGLEPQTPLTFKRLAIDGEIHKLNDDEKELSLTEGVLTTSYDYDLGYYTVLQGVNTLQNNEFLVNDDGTSFSIQVRRITAQLNKEIIVNAKRVFFGKDMVGPNRNTVGPEDIEAWLEGFLQDRIASSLNDNLIMRFANIVVTVPEEALDTYYISYEFVPNFEVNKMIFTGILLAA